MSSKKIKSYPNSTYCSNCNEKMYFTRKQRLYFHWIEILDRGKGMITQVKCKFCDSIYCKWTGNSLGKYDIEKAKKQLLNEDI